MAYSNERERVLGVLEELVLKVDSATYHGVPGPSLSPYLDRIMAVMAQQERCPDCGEYKGSPYCPNTER